MGAGKNSKLHLCEKIVSQQNIAAKKIMILFMMMLWSVIF